MIPLLICFAPLLISCGRRDQGYILNDTKDTLTLKLTLNYRLTEKCPDNYFRSELINRERSNQKEYKSGGDCLISYDTSSNIAILKLNPKDKLKLGTIRDGSRENYECWDLQK
jgi:hypothetical protein